MKNMRIKTALLGLVVAGGLVFGQPAPAYAKMVSSYPEGDARAETTAEVQKPGSDLVAAELKGDKVNISLERAMELTMSNSPDVHKAQNELKSAEVAAEQSRSQAKKVEQAVEIHVPASLVGNWSGAVMQKDQTYYAATVYGPAATKKAVTLRQYALEAQEAACKLQTIQAYFTVLCDGQSEVSALYALEKAQNQLRVVQSRYEQGMATKLEVLSATAQVNGANTALAAARAKTVQDKRSLNVTMGLDPETNWSPSSKLDFVPMKIADVDKKAQELMEIAPMVNIARVTFELAELSHDNSISETPAFTYAGQTAELTYDTAKVEYEHAKDTYYIGAKALIENMSLAAEQYKIYQESQGLLEEVYRLTVLQYENGLNTQNDIQAAAADIVSNDAQRLSALLQYNVAKTAIEQGLIQ